MVDKRSRGRYRSSLFLAGFMFLLLLLVKADEPLPFKSAQVEYEHFFNHGSNPNSKKFNNKDSPNNKLDNEVLKSKVEVLGEVLKHRVQALRHVPGQKVELIFLVDSSASVGADNFFNELKFVRKLLADFTVSSDAARVAVVTFSSKNRVVRHIDHLSPPNEEDDDEANSISREEKHKCRLLEQELPAITYTGGGTYTLGALLEAQSVLEEARPEAVKAVFLITDGYSNGGDPRPAAKRLREQGVQVFTFGIRNGNVKELYDMASEPAQEHSYIVDSFEEFEALARRALHEDLQMGSYLVQNNRSSCDRLCKEASDCCHSTAQCTCGTHTGHYACLCPPGYYGTGLKNDCHPCPGGTYRSDGGPGDLRSCRSCPDENHISPPGSTSVNQCTCPRGYIPSEEDEGRSCHLLACPKLEPPRNGYFVKQACNSVFNGACGIRCNAGYKLTGSSIRICQENGTWSGEDALCLMRSCGPVPAPKNGHVQCTSEEDVIDSECNFTCDPGFTLVGSSKRVCLPIGYWDGLPAFCKPVFCNPLPKVINGTILPAKCLQVKMRYAEECAVTCAPGYELRGPAERRCSEQGKWTDEEIRTRCIDITPPEITCPADVMTEAEEGENFAIISWDLPKTSDNSGIQPEIISIPAITEQPMRFRIGASTVMYKAYDRRGNQGECTFQVTVTDNQPPIVDQCESPPIFLLRDRDVSVVWDEPQFSDNSGKAPTVSRSHNPGPFPLGETEVIYTAEDESGNNSTCILVIRVQEHACNLPTDPIHGQANCSQEPEAVYCSLTCHDGYAFALPPPRNYFCAYDGQWLPADSPLPFPDCSITTHSDAFNQDGLMRLAGDEEKICQDPFLMNQMEGHLKRRLVSRLNEICGDNMICQIDDLQAECRQVVTEESQSENGEENEPSWDQSNEILHRNRRNIVKLKKTNLTSAKNGTMTVELRFKVTSRFPNKEGENETRVRNLTQKILLEELRKLRTQLTEAALAGEFNVNTTGRFLNVFAVQFNGDGHPKYNCPVGSVPMQGNEEAWAKCVYCPIGTFFNVVNEVCESCTQGSYQPEEGQLSCLVCPGNTSTKVINAKHQDDCQAKCLAGTYSPTGLEPCSTCPQGTYQTEYSKRFCQPCPDGSTTWRRGARRLEDCKPVCPRGHVSETGLAPCFQCPSGFFQSLNGQKFCIRCPKRAPFTISAGTVDRMECLSSLVDLNETLPEPDATEEFEEAFLLEVNECFSLPCLNGGQCQTLDFGYVCICPAGFTGMQCQIDVDECDSIPCQNGATCLDSVNSYECVCPDGFSGQQCEIDIDECISGPCFPGSTCVDRTSGYTCICPSGMIGTLCELEVDECVSNPCQNGGSCYDRLANYSCACLPGWTGKLCEEAIDECLSQPCTNGATCEDLIGKFICHCPIGYDGELCQNDVDECAIQPCASGGTCVDRLGSFACLCPPGIVGSTCDTVVDPDYSLDFTSAGKLDYAAWEDGLRVNHSLSQLTLCAWIKTVDETNYGTVFSYATDANPNTFTLTDYSGFVIYINGVQKVTDVTSNDGLWHLVCITWSSIPDGLWSIYSDGELKSRGNGLATNTTISPKGTVILGQEQDNRGGGFSNAESFVGQLYGVELWDSVLTEKLIAGLTISCGDSLRGNLITWADFKHGLRGGVRVQESPFCRGCSLPRPPKHGHVNVTGNEAVYSCETGYVLTTMYQKRPCLIHGGWSGPDPECQRISCGFPGYILNGLVYGSSFVFGDTITYNCTRGFKMSGESSRSCQESGEWSGQPPECVPHTCDPLSPPFNGSIVGPQQGVYAVGDKVFFQCSTGFRLDGPSALTCQDEGQWEDVIPVCQPLACTQPPYVEHGIVTNGVAEILPEDLPSFLVPGSILTFSCQFGFQLESSAEVQCSHDGFWIGRIPKCIPIRCGKPPEILNGQVHFSRPDDDRVGAVASYVCQSGYEHFGPAELECTESATWLDRNKEASLPVCMLVDCGPLPMIVNGEVYTEEETFGSRAPVSCHSEFKLIGVVDWIECQADKQWSAPPLCQPITCYSPPTPITNGNLPHGPFAAGEYIQYTCEDGFQLSGSTESIMCTENGTWLGDIPQCIPMECSSPPQIESGWWTFTSSTDGGELDDRTIFCTGAEVTYSCQDGYQLEGERVLRCLGSVGWLPLKSLSVCRKKTSHFMCPPLNNPPQGTILVEGFEPGQTAILECNKGFQPNDGSGKLSCNSDGTWSSTPGVEEPLSCIDIVCKEPGALINGSVSYTSLNYGSKAIFQCDPGFIMIGSQQQICGSTGEWIGEPSPQCVARHCTLPEIIEHGSIGFQGNLSRGSSIHYKCEEGYKIVGARERFCLPSGDWSEEEPSCQIIYCELLPGQLEHGSVTGSEDSTYGTTVQFSCDHGYELLGNERISCSSDGKWDGSFPVCRPVQCPNPGLVAHSTISLKKANSRAHAQIYQYGDILGYECRKGYVFSKTNNTIERHCLADGTWSGKPPVCSRITCRDLAIPLNGYTSRPIQSELLNGEEEKYIGAALAGQVVHFGCKPGYQRMAGSASAKCLETGKWNISSLPNCQPVRCSHPPQIKNGNMGGSVPEEYVFSYQVKYACNSGFRMKGEPHIICTSSGSWSTPFPTCNRVVCPQIDSKDLDNGFITFSFDSTDLRALHPMLLKFSCKDGYDLVGSPLAQCTSTGDWSHPLPTCVPWSCDSPPIPLHGKIQSTEVSSNSVVVNIQCDRGYELSSNGSVTCDSSGIWKGKVECLPQLCSTPEYITLQKHVIPVSPFKSSYQFGARISFYCQEGYAMESQNTSLTCGEKSRWDGEIPSCVPIRCPTVEAPSYGSISGFSTSVGSKISVTCNENYYLEGKDHIICQLDGHWSDSMPLCSALFCRNPPQIDNGWIVMHGNQVGDITSYSCQSGYHLLGESIRTCLRSGMWSGEDPVCDPVVCPVPEVPNHGTWIVSGFVPGSNIRFECQTGYALIGSVSITCLMDKSWSDRPPKCQRVTCPALKDPEHGKVHIFHWKIENHEFVDSTALHNMTAGYHSVAHYKCGEGYNLFGPEKRTCTALGSWSERGPQCQRIWCVEPQAPDQGFVMGTGKQYGDRIRYVCSAGYRLVGDDESICKADGSWSSPVPYCQALNCNASPPVVQHSITTIGKTWSTGTQIVFRCQDGYIQIGDLSTQCLPNQKWSTIKGHCQRVECDPPVIQGASFVVRKSETGLVLSNSIYHPGDRAIIACHSSNGKQRNRTIGAILICQSDGHWAGQPPICNTEQHQQQCDTICLNGGSCTISNLSKKCICSPGYSGDKCQFAICDPPCLNGGRCISPNTCHCPIGISGLTCHKKSGELVHVQG